MESTKRSTKDKILHLLKKEVSLTVSDLTSLLAITHMAIRKHLTVLEKDGLIISKEVKQPMGRPLQSYSLSPKGELFFPKNYEGISVEFLRDIKDLHGDSAIQVLFKKRENRLTHEYKSRINQLSPFEKVQEIATIQNEKGYMAEVNQIDNSTFELVEYNCPIFAIAREFKTACHCETEMFKNVSDTKDVNRISCKTDGDNHCKFLFKY